MELFDKKFVYFMWDDELKGKECFYDDNIEGLRDTVNKNKTDFKGCLEPNTSDYPFRHILRGKTCYSWRFVYYDPNYECKVAYSEGKKIQHRRKGKSVWCDGTPCWDSRYEYRIKPTHTKKALHSTCFMTSKKRRMTNRELAKWLAEGKGQKIDDSNKFAYTAYAYKDDDNAPCRKDVMIRAWNETEWHEPEVEQ